MWPALAAALGVEAGLDEPLSMAAYLGERAGLWDEVIRKYDLQPIPLPALLGESHHYADLCFNYGSDSSPPPAFTGPFGFRVTR